MTNRMRIAYLSASGVQVLSVLLACLALSGPKTPLAAIALGFNIVALFFAVFGVAEVLNRLRADPKAEPFNSAKPLKSVTYPLTGHQAPPILCDKCMAFTEETIDEHLDHHVLLTDDCAICEHMREGEPDDDLPICMRCGRFTSQEVDYHLSGHILLDDECPICAHIREGQSP